MRTMIAGLIALMACAAAVRGELKEFDDTYYGWLCRVASFEGMHGVSFYNPKRDARLWIGCDAEKRTYPLSIIFRFEGLEELAEGPVIMEYSFKGERRFHERWALDDNSIGLENSHAVHYFLNHIADGKEMITFYASGKDVSTNKIVSTDVFVIVFEKGAPKAAEDFRNRCATAPE